ncbi:hypothetical protein MKL09_04425 [Methylobacterium sp. J-048]|uniref:hypothetical protein n=1 Tax=Methylobacterium sp. J-048 TaxID=2836635 RepID=UPI001FBB53B5|nr:hypothetical protein [Methylobacterium sp. J-048]MCJ2055792.1 hypothetical protein [Methylobacterium sp. J-048]
MSAGLSFGALPAFADLTPDQQAMVMQALQQGQPQAPASQAAPGAPGGLLSPADPQTTGAIPDRGGPPVAMNEADTRRLEEQMGMRAPGGGQQPGSPDQLLYDRAGMGGGANGFSGSAGSAIPQADAMGARPVPMPPQRPSDADLAALPATTGALPPPGVPQRQAVASSAYQPDAPAVGPRSAGMPPSGRFSDPSRATTSATGDFDPLTGQVTSGQPRPLGAPQGAVSPTGAAAATGTSSGLGGASVMEKFAQGITAGNPDFGNLLFHLGIGIASNRGIGPGISAGLQSYGASQSGSLKGQLEQIKFMQEQQGERDTYNHLTQNLKLDPTAARAAMRNSTLLSNVLTQAKPNYQTIGGQLYDLNKNGGVPGPANLIGPASGPPAGYRLGADGQSLEFIPGGEADPAQKAKLAAAGRDGSYTLSPGQTRYDEEGKPVTAVPAAPRELRPGATLYDPVTLKPIVSAPSAKPDGFDTETKLRGEFSKQLGSFADVHDGYGRLIAATKQREANPGTVSPASDISLVFGYMKMLDPGSVVREGEYATAKNAAGVPERVMNAYNKALSGEFLSDTQRKDFLGQASELYGTARKTAEGVADRYRGLAQQYGVSPDRAVYLPEMPIAPKLGQQSQASGGAAARYQSLIQGGMSKADAFAQMHKEGL